jgi:hypothetical protein
LAVDLFGLEVDRHRSFGGDVGMGAALGGAGSAAADLAGSTHGIKLLNYKVHDIIRKDF